MAQGERGASREPLLRESPSMIIPPVLLGLMSLALGLYIPPALGDLIREAARSLGAGS
jgi:hypothetical protein